MTTLLALIFSAATTVGVAVLGHQLHIAHFHLIGGIPVGAMGIGAGAALGTAIAIRLTNSYDTDDFRTLAYVAGFLAYSLVVSADYMSLHLRVGDRVLPATEIMNVARYLMFLVEEGAKSAAAVLPKWVKVPPQITFWVGMVRLSVEVVGMLVATGWALSFVTGVPFCVRNRRFYELKYVVESANTSAVREWELAVHQRRPIEARAILARVRAGRPQLQDRVWTRVVIHQCPVCLAGRVRIEKCKRGPGFVRAESQEEFLLDEARGSALLAT
jgi:hypothetical protein